MNTADLHIEQNALHRLLSAANPDSALLYLYLHSGNDPQAACSQLHMSQSRVSCALAVLRQLGLWQEQESRSFTPGERPAYSEQDVLQAMDADRDFQALYTEIQRLLGRTLNTEEMKIILGFVRYLGLPVDVVCVLVGYCKERARQKGSLRNPSLRTIEKEAYRWAELSIDTMEEAAAFIQNQNMRNSRLGKLKDLLQIRGRAFTPSEEKYALAWLDMGFEQEAIALAYDRTCLNTGGLNWAYMHKILTRWHQANCLTVEQVKQAQRAYQGKDVPKGASGKLGEAELAAIEKVLREG